MRRPDALEPAQRSILEGKVVRVCSARLGGDFLGLVRSASRDQLTVQRPGGGGTSLSARFRGARVRVLLLEVVGVLNRRARPHRTDPLEVFLEREAERLKAEAEADRKGSA